MALAMSIAGATDAAAQRGPGGGGRGAAAPAVTLADVKVARMNERIAAVGSARARQQVTLTTRVAGVIAEVLFEGGQLVEANQPLVKLNAEPEAIAVETAEAQRAAGRRHGRALQAAQRGHRHARCRRPGGYGAEGGRRRAAPRPRRPRPHDHQGAVQGHHGAVEPAGGRLSRRRQSHRADRRPRDPAHRVHRAGSGGAVDEDRHSGARHAS